MFNWTIIFAVTRFSNFIYIKKRSYILLCIFSCSLLGWLRSNAVKLHWRKISVPTAWKVPKELECVTSYFRQTPIKSTLPRCVPISFTIWNMLVIFKVSQKAVRHAIYKLVPFLMFSTRCAVSAVCSGCWLRKRIIPVSCTFLSLFTAGMLHVRAV